METSLSTIKPAKKSPSRTVWGIPKCSHMNQVEIDPYAAHTQTIIVEVVGATDDHFPSSELIFVLGGA